MDAELLNTPTPPEGLERALRRKLRAEGKLLKTLGAQDVLEVAVRFWLDTPVDGLRANEGDGLVAYFELLDRRGTVYEFGVNRMLRLAGDSGSEWPAWSPGWKLRFSIGFKPTREVFQLRPVVIAFDCWHKAGSELFISEVRQSLPFKLVSQYQQHVSSINLSECSSPSGAAFHPTRGLSWAIA